MDEANWYQSLPKEISCYAPRVFDVSEDGEFARVEMELYGYANLAETFIYGSNNLEDWYNIIEALLKVHKVFENTPRHPTAANWRKSTSSRPNSGWRKLRQNIRALRR